VRCVLGRNSRAPRERLSIFLAQRCDHPLDEFPQFTCAELSRRVQLGTCSRTRRQASLPRPFARCRRSSSDRPDTRGRRGHRRGEPLTTVSTRCSQPRRTTTSPAPPPRGSISPRGNYLSSAIRKLGARNRREAIERASEKAGSSRAAEPRAQTAILQCLSCCSSCGSSMPRNRTAWATRGPHKPLRWAETSRPPKWWK
jgi:hypothetical protein